MGKRVCQGDQVRKIRIGKRVQPAPSERRIIDCKFEGLGWDTYKSTWPGCTWLWLYRNPYPLKVQLDYMTLASFDIGEGHRRKRIKAWLS
jgi:hypothetical protein